MPCTSILLIFRILNFFSQLGYYCARGKSLAFLHECFVSNLPPSLSKLSPQSISMTILHPVPLQPTWHTQCQPFWSRVHRPFPKQSPGQPSEKTAESNSCRDIRMGLANSDVSAYREEFNHLGSVRMRCWINAKGACLLATPSQGTCYPWLCSVFP